MSSNGNISALPALFWGKAPITGIFPSKRSVTRSFGVFFDLRLNKRLNKQLRRRWFETPPRSLWRHRRGILNLSGLDGIDAADPYEANTNPNPSYFMDDGVCYISTEAHIFILYLQRSNSYSWRVGNGYRFWLSGLTHLPMEKWPPFRRWYFHMHFREWKDLYFDWNFTQVCS